MPAPARSTLAELTPRVILLGAVLSVVMGAANVYLGLRVGLTVSASIPAAVVAMLILRGLLRDGTILEANQVQTAASAGESLAAGIIFTMPALVIIGVWTEFDWLMTTAIAFAGGLLGILFMIPMRRVFVVADDNELKYPEGVACAAVLEAGEGQDTDGAATRIVGGALWGVVFALAAKYFKIIQGSLATATAAGGRIFYFGGDISPALVAVGFIVRLEVAVLIFLGGAIGWLIGIPLLAATPEQLAAPLDGAFDLWGTQIRYIGVGAMVVGGLDAIYKVRHGLVRAVTELRNKKTGPIDDSPGERDLPSRAITTAALIATAVVALVYYRLTGDLVETLITTAIMLVMSFFFTAVASYIVGLVGNSNSPVSGMTITAVLVTGGLLFLFGYTGAQGMVATLGVAAIVCCAACTSGDVCNDLKTGQLVGASPYRQQIMQIIGVAVACGVMAPVMQLLHEHGGGIGSKELPAPQAGLFASLAEGFFGDGVLPWDMVGWGVGLGVAVLVVDRVLKASGARFRAHLMPIAVGIYLPFELATPILVGGLIAWALSRGKTDAEADEVLRPGVLFASGAIAGESLTGIALAILASAQLAPPDLGLGQGAITVLTAAAAIATALLFTRYGKRWS
ncbi:MAG: oligopeptide transporter, OPT family [Myxococcales bacterium]|nr:oligopeptide transporter, OPT family [Myxococcales bacterium]MCB9542965.1 oligopeptide transporter, OPT family [Myxococcales bacterium]